MIKEKEKEGETLTWKVRKNLFSSIVIAHKLFPLITASFVFLFPPVITKTVKLVPFREYNISPFSAVSQ